MRAVCCCKKILLALSSIDESSRWNQRPLDVLLCLAQGLICSKPRTPRRPLDDSGCTYCGRRINLSFILFFYALHSLLVVCCPALLQHPLLYCVHFFEFKYLSGCGLLLVRLAFSRFSCVSDYNAARLEILFTIISCYKNAYFKRQREV